MHILHAISLTGFHLQVVIYHLPASFSYL